MTGYLASIVGRETAARGVGERHGEARPAASRGPGAIVPRVASTYEPWMIAAADDAPREPTLDAPTPISPSDVATEEGAASRPSATSPAPMQPEAAPPPPVIEASPIAPRVVPGMEPARDAARAEGPSVERIVEHERHERHASASRAEEGRAVMEQGTVVQRVVPAERDAPHRAPRAETQRTVEPNTVVPRTAVTVQATVHRAEQRRAEAGTRADAAPEREPPAVVVTIGRIDVRAVTTPPPSSAAASPRHARAMLSLEEYLQQRAQGNR